jgi:hypothetical protein
MNLCFIQKKIEDEKKSSNFTPGVWQNKHVEFLANSQLKLPNSFLSHTQNAGDDDETTCILVVVGRIF